MMKLGSSRIAYQLGRCGCQPAIDQLVCVLLRPGQDLDSLVGDLRALVGRWRGGDERHRTGRRDVRSLGVVRVTTHALIVSDVA